MKRRMLIFGALALLGILMVACGGEEPPPEVEPTDIPAAARPTTPTAQPLPDLVISSGQMTMTGYTGSCVPELSPLATEVCVQNQGEGGAGPFVVWVRHRQGGDRFEWQIEELEAGQEVCLEEEGYPVGRATVDVEDQVAEANERNNNLILSLPTPPVVCTVTPTPTNTPTPLPPGVPTPTPYPEDAQVRTEIFPIWDCVYLGNEVYQWYRAEVTFVDGERANVEIIRGPFMGDRQGGCPSNPAEPTPGPAPTSAR